MNNKRTLLFAMPNILSLGKKVSKKLNLNLSKIRRTEFADGETILQSETTVRNKDVYIIASTSKPVNASIMELLIFIDSLKRASAKTINVIFTYYGYARQDRKTYGRQPITSKLIADMLEKAGTTKVTLIDIHNPSIQGFFNVPADDLRGAYIFTKEIKKLGQFTVVSPDHGGATRARLLSEALYDDVYNVAIIDKRRTGPNQTETLGVLGDVKNKNVVLIDDIIDTGGTIIKAAKTLKSEGAKKIIVVATHGLFSKKFSMFDDSKEISQVLVTDSVSSVHNIKSNKLRIISIASYISGTIKATIESKSISSVYKKIKRGKINY